MGTMNKMRENTGVVLWILVFAFGIIWVLQDSGGLDVVGQTTGTNIIVVDGDPVTYEQYSQALNAQMQQYQAQTGEPMSPQMVDLTRDRIFDQLVDLRLREQEMERLGIEVTDEEVYEMVLGDTPHPIISSYFGDGQGGINRALLQSFAQDPEARAEWLQLEQYLRTQRAQEKLDNLIQATVRVSEQDVLDAYQQRNRTANARYVALRYAALPDDSVSVSEGDLRDFYDEHREDFHRERTYTLRYVSRSKEPTAQDTSVVLDELDRLRERFAAAEDDSLFVAQNASEQPYTSTYFRADELQPAIAEALFPNPEEGTVVGPLVAGDNASLVKVQDVRPAEEPVVRARHILFRAPEGDEAARTAALEEARTVLNQIQQGTDFAEMAREHSDDGTAMQGGDLGWFGRGRMVQPFAEAAFDAGVGQVVGPVETQFGYHLIEVTDRADQEVQIANYAMGIRPNVSTLNDIQEQLDDLQYYADESGDFEAEAERLGLNVQQVQVEAEQQFIPGLGNSRTIMNFLEGAEEGDLSSVIELDDQFVVLQVRDIQAEGYRPFSEVQDEIRPRAVLAAKRDVQRERLERALAANDFSGLADALGTQEQTATGLTFTNPVVQGLGREPKFVGTALGQNEGAVSAVVEGENAAYVLMTTQIQEPAPISPAQREQIRQQLLQQRRSQVQSQWIAQLRENADIEDYRRRFEQ